ncbi:YciI family protein, partial [Streptomyces massasporeus]|uniref:YciI family protein n=1 Tax=Streptomyces massasporeus TaxID=67324 RepID=UPI0033FBDCE9
MFVPELVYTAPPEAVDAVLAEHVVGLDEQYRQGVFLASGRTVPRDGGSDGREFVSVHRGDGLGIA